VFAYRLGIAKIMILLQEAIEYGLGLAASYLHKLQRLDRPEAAVQFSGLDVWRLGSGANSQRVASNLPHPGKFYDTAAMHLEHHSTADHIAEYTVGLNPVPFLAKQYGKFSPAGSGILPDELPDKRYIYVGKHS
jgi:hypothetical protein